MKIILSTASKMVKAEYEGKELTIPSTDFRIVDLGDLLVGDDKDYVNVEVYRGADDILDGMDIQ